MTRHLVADVHFPPRSDDGACLCECGWRGLASEFAAHRKTVRAPNSYHTRENGPSWWKTAKRSAA